MSKRFLRWLDALAGGLAWPNAKRQRPWRHLTTSGLCSLAGLVSGDRAKVCPAKSQAFSTAGTSFKDFSPRPWLGLCNTSFRACLGAHARPPGRRQDHRTALSDDCGALFEWHSGHVLRTPTWPARIPRVSDVDPKTFPVDDWQRQGGQRAASPLDERHIQHGARLGHAIASSSQMTHGFPWREEGHPDSKKAVLRAPQPPNPGTTSAAPTRRRNLEPLTLHGLDRCRLRHGVEQAKITAAC